MRRSSGILIFALAAAFSSFAAIQYYTSVSPNNKLPRCGSVEENGRVLRFDGNGKPYFEELSNEFLEEEKKYQKHKAEYKRSALDNLRKSIFSTYDKSPMGMGQPFELNILFVDDLHGAGGTDAYDAPGGIVQLSSPWVRLIRKKDSPCALQVIFFNQWRQIMRDQLEMKAGTKIVWDSSATMSDREYNSYVNEYVDFRLGQKAHKIPKDVMPLFLNSSFGTIGNWAPDYSIVESTSGLYAKFVDDLVNESLHRPRSTKTYDSPLDVGNGMHEYLVENFKSSIDGPEDW